MLLAVLSVATYSACSREQTDGSGHRQAQPSSQPSSGAADRQSFAEIVASALPEGWTLAGRVEQFTPQSLYEKIDGRAELFLSYDVVGLTFASFESPRAPDVFIDVYVYEMGSATDAFGVFSVERSPDESSVDIGRAGCRSDADLYIWKGRFYLKVMASETGDALARTSEAVARKLAGSLADSTERVWGRRAMPPRDRVPGSLRYFRVDAMGLDFMRNTYTAQYRKGNVVVQAFLSRRESAADAESTVAAYARHAETYGKGVEHLTVAGALVLCDMGGTFDVVLQKGRLVAGVVGVKIREDAVQAAVDLRKQLDSE